MVVSVRTPLINGRPIDVASFADRYNSEDASLDLSELKLANRHSRRKKKRKQAAETSEQERGHSQ